MPEIAGAKFTVVAAVAVKFLIAVVWIGLEGGLQRGSTAWAADKAGKQINSFWPLCFFDNLMANDDPLPV